MATLTLVPRGRGVGGFAFGNQAALNKANVRARGPITTVITVQGLNAVIEDQVAVAQIIHNGAGAIVDFTAKLGSEFAKEIHRPHIRTGATFNSISQTEAGTRSEGFGNWVSEFGPETLQAKLLEFGFVHIQSGRFIQFPFLIPAAEIIEPLMEQAMVQLVEVAGNRRQFTNSIARDSGAQDMLSSLRNSLYSFSKFAGDIAVFGVRLPGRSAGLRAARLIGDVKAGMRGALGRRVSFRISGSFASRGLRAQIQTRVVGPSGSFQGIGGRIINRISGQAVGRGISEGLG